MQYGESDKMMISKLPEAEFEVMKTIWENPSPISTKEVFAYANKSHPTNWALSTVQSLLSRLTARGFLFTEKDGKDRVYSPKISLVQYQKFEADVLVQKYDRSLLGLTSALITSKKLQPEELRQLRMLFEQDKGDA